MSLESLIAKVKDLQPSFAQKTIVKPNLCACELYAIGVTELLVTLWHPSIGPSVFGPELNKVNVEQQPNEPGRPTAHEVHSSPKIVGCLYRYDTLSTDIQQKTNTAIKKAWGL